jgi:hypothetical protein
LGRIVSIGQTYAGLSVPVQFTQQFDAVGNRTQLAAAINETADFVNDYQFDALRRMTRVTQHDVGYASSVPVAEKRVDLAYNAIGQFTGIMRYADLAATVLVTTSTFDYDTDARLTILAHKRADDSSINTYTSTYDSLNRITSQGSIDGSSTYTYDETSQLVAADQLRRSYRPRGIRLRRVQREATGDTAYCWRGKTRRSRGKNKTVYI